MPRFQVIGDMIPAPDVMPCRLPPRMGPAQTAALLDAAMRSRHAEVYLRAAVTMFEILGRRQDAEVGLWLCRLLAEGEIEEILSQRARWRRG